MRHGKKLNHLGRTDSHRKAMMANMATSLILHKRITTTLAKAKALRPYVEPLLTKSKSDTTHSRRTVFSYLNDKDAVTILFREIAKKIASRPGGYTRIIKMENRLGDNAEMAMIELVDYNTVYTKEDIAPVRKSTRRRGGSGNRKIETDVAIAEPEAEKAESKLVDRADIDFRPLENTYQSMILRGEPNYVEGFDPKVDAYETYHLLKDYYKDGEVSHTIDPYEEKLIAAFDLLDDKQKKKRLEELKSIFNRKP